MTRYRCENCHHVTFGSVPFCPNCITTPTTMIEHATAARQRAQMHAIVVGDAKLRRDEIEHMRRKAEQADARRNQPITRGEILDAIDQAMHVRGGNVGDHNEADMELLRALREAFE